MIKVNLIGEGRWSEKISRILEVSEPLKYAPIKFATSDFEHEKLKNLDQEIIWLTLFPDSQIEQINKLKHEEVKVILEKPYYVNFEQRARFFDAISGFERKFWPSIPWQFGKPWLEFEESVNLSKGSISLEVIHRGRPSHKSIPFSIDWCSHDFNMIVKIFEKMHGSVPSISRVFPDKNSLTIHFNEGSLVKFVNELSEINEYRWNFRIGEESGSFDFLDFAAISQEVTNHPIVKMLDQVQSNRQGLTKETLRAVDSLLSAMIESGFQGGELIN
jgi:hypothetical protein